MMAMLRSEKMEWLLSLTQNNSEGITENYCKDFLIFSGTLQQSWSYRTHNKLLISSCPVLYLLVTLSAIYFRNCKLYFFSETQIVSKDQSESWKIDSSFCVIHFVLQIWLSLWYWQEIKKSAVSTFLL